jgi:iron complex outermembrane recepter protein
VFGLNTLGGALSINTKSGLQYPGFTAAAYGGSWGRSSSEFEWGGHGKNADFFVTAHYLDEDGWRDFSASRLKQLFAKAGFDDEQQTST